MEFERNEINKTSMGGTELMMDRLYKSIDPDLLSKFQIIASRVRELDESKVRILWLHDLPEDPESHHLANNGWNKFHKIVFVSNWQMNEYMRAYQIPFSRCVVMHNGIEPFGPSSIGNGKSRAEFRIGYWSTPHRGLQLLVPIFKKLCEKHNNISLDVFSSFEIYGWPERDKDFEALYAQCNEHPKINYYGTLPQNELRTKLSGIHILGYPSIWLETSCLVLMEAMSAGMLCIHPNVGALPETGANWTTMYQFNEDINVHANIFAQCLDNAIQQFNDKDVYDTQIKPYLNSQKAYADIFYNWSNRAIQWTGLLNSLKDLPTQLEKPSFNYKVV